MFLRYFLALFFVLAAVAVGIDGAYAQDTQEIQSQTGGTAVLDLEEAVDVAPLAGRRPVPRPPKVTKPRTAKPKASAPGKKAKTVKAPSKTVKAAPGKKSKVKNIWASNRNYSSTKSAYYHWKKHGKDFPKYKNSVQYVKGANKFISSPPKGTAQFARKNGETMYYHRGTNTFAVKNRNGEPMTMFKPKMGEKYWRDQLKKWE